MSTSIFNMFDQGDSPEASPRSSFSFSASPALRSRIPAANPIRRFSPEPGPAPQLRAAFPPAQRAASPGPRLQPRGQAPPAPESIFPEFNVQPRVYHRGVTPSDLFDS
jgi:hypothetical protein